MRWQILNAYGLNERLVDTVNLNYTDAAKKLKSGDIDAFFCTAGVQTTVINELSKQCKIRLVSLDQKGVSRLKKSYKFYTEYTIPAGTYVNRLKKLKLLVSKLFFLQVINFPKILSKTLHRFCLRINSRFSMHYL